MAEVLTRRAPRTEIPVRITSTRIRDVRPGLSIAKVKAEVGGKKRVLFTSADPSARSHSTLLTLARETDQDIALVTRPDVVRQAQQRGTTPWREVLYEARLNARGFAEGDTPLTGSALVEQISLALVFGMSGRNNTESQPQS